MKKELDLKYIILTLVGFIIFWSTITNAWGYSEYLFVNNDIGTYIYSYISRLIWVIPAIWLIIKYNDQLQYNRKELFSSFQLNKSFVLVVTVIFIYIIVGMLVNHHGFWLNSQVSLSLVLIKYMVVGFVEEIVFRGWGYNSLVPILSHKKAMIITTILFILLHFPSYFIKFWRFGIFDYTGLIIQSISALIWGAIFCWLLKGGKSLWNPILIHTIYDLMSVLLIGGS